MDAIKSLLKQVNAYWAGKDKNFKRNVIILAGVLVTVIIILSILMNRVDYAILYSGLDAQDSASIISALTTQNEPKRVDGDTIYVPAKDADELRITLSTQISNGFNLDILKQGQGLGLTESDKQDYRKYQVQSDLQNSLRTLQGIKDAQVVLTMPSDSVLVIDSDKQAATAGVILTLDNGYDLTSAQIKGIAMFVQKAVPGLTLDNISIMDSNSQVLNFSGSDDNGVSANDRFALQASVEASLRKQVMALLLPIFGVGRVEAQVNVALDFDDKTTDSVTYAPVVNDKDGVISSYQKLKEQIVNGSSAGSQPGTATNTGTGSTSTSTSGTTSYPAVNVDNGTYEKNEDTVNYEVNQVKEHLQQEKGAVKTLSVSVVIDNTNLKTDLSANVKSLVTNAVGALKDNVSVEYMPMTGSLALTSALSTETAAKEAVAKSQQNLIYIVLAAVVLVAVVGMMMLFIGKRSKEKAALAREAAIYAEQNPVPNGGVVDEVTGEIYETQEELEAIKIVRDNSAKEQIGQLIERNPELVANLLRSWLADDRE